MVCCRVWLTYIHYKPAWAGVCRGVALATAARKLLTIPEQP